MRKPFFVILIILTVIGSYFIWKRSPNQNQLQDLENRIATQQVSQSKNSESLTQDNTESSEQNQVPLGKTREKEQVLSDVFKVFKAFGDKVEDEDITIDPDVKKLLLLMKTPAYKAFLETEPTSLADFYDFYASHGIPLDKNKLFDAAEKEFKKYFPDESAEELKPRMRQALIKLYDESGGDPFVLINFVINEKYASWGTHYFKTDSEAFVEWGADIIRDYSSSQTEIPAGETEDAVLFDDVEPSAGSIKDDLPTAASETTHIPKKMDTNPKENADEAKKDIEATLEAEILSTILNSTRQQPQGLSKTPNLNRELHRVFPPARVKVALLILNRNVPQKALSELKKSDPEIAAYIERFVQRIIE